MSSSLLQQNTLFYGQGAIDGLQFGKKIMYNDPKKGWVEASLGCYVEGYDNEKTGDFVSPMLCYIDNNDLYITISDEITQDNVILTISGSALPGAEIYLTQLTDESILTDWYLINLKRNKAIDANGNILKAVAGKDGTYSFKGVRGLKAGPIVAWYKTSTFYFTTAALTMNIEVGAGKIDLVGYFIYKTKMTEKHYCSDCSVTYDCPHCNGTGTVDNITCPTCEGRLTLIRGKGCMTNADGKIVSCTKCSGTGTSPLKKYYYVIAGDAPTESSETSTNIHDIQLSILPNSCKCSNCDGKGTVDSNNTIDCPGCGGTGSITLTDNTSFACKVCNNTGKLTVPTTCTICNGKGTTLTTEIDTASLELLTKRSNEITGGTLQLSLESYEKEDKTGRMYNMTWDKLSESTNKDDRVIVWTCSDNETDAITITTGNHVIEEGVNDGSDDAVCLAEGTLITMADGSKKPIEEVKIDDYIMDGKGNPSKVYWLGRHYKGSPHTYYYFEDGTVIHEVTKHRFYNVEQGFYQLMKNWKIGEHALNQDGKEIALINKEIFNEELVCYAVYCSSGNYYANGLLSGQGFCNQNFLAEMTAS